MSFIELLIILLITLFAMMFHLILHEVGHMIGGLLSGYKIIFIRFGSLTFLKEEDHWSFKRFSIANTGGQCIMQPPKENVFHFRLYFLGGVIMNALITLFAIWLLFIDNEYVFMFAFELIYMGIFFICMNGLPLKISGIVNDGYHVFRIKKQDEIKLYYQLMISTLDIQGMTLASMNESWFNYDESQTNNFYDGYLIYVDALRHLDLNDYHEARRLLELLINDPQCIQFYRINAKKDLMLLDVEENGYSANIEQYIDKKLMKTIKQQKYDLSSLLAYYCILVIKEKNIKQALVIENHFLMQKDRVIDKGEVSLNIKRYENIKKQLGEIR